MLCAISLRPQLRVFFLLYSHPALRNKQQTSATTSHGVVICQAVFGEFEGKIFSVALKLWRSIHTSSTYSLPIPFIWSWGVQYWPAVPALLLVLLDSFAPTERAQILAQAATHCSVVWVLRRRLTPGSAICDSGFRLNISPFSV